MRNFHGTCEPLTTIAAAGIVSGAEVQAVTTGSIDMALAAVQQHFQLVDKVFKDFDVLSRNILINTSEPIYNLVLVSK